MSGMVRLIKIKHDKHDLSSVKEFIYNMGKLIIIDNPVKRTRNVTIILHSSPKSVSAILFFVLDSMNSSAISN